MISFPCIVLDLDNVPAGQCGEAWLERPLLGVDGVKVEVKALVPRSDGLASGENRVPMQSVKLRNGSMKFCVDEFCVGIL